MRFPATGTVAPMLTRQPNAGARRWWYWPWHAVLLGAYPVLFLFAQNLADQVTLQPLWGPLFVCMAAAAGLLLLFYAVRREWENARRQEMIEQFYRKLLEKYEIIVERPKAGAPEGDR